MHGAHPDRSIIRSRTRAGPSGSYLRMAHSSLVGTGSDWSTSEPDLSYDLKQFVKTKEIITSVSQARVNGILSGKGALADTLRSGTFDGNLGADKMAGMLSFSLGWATNRFGRAALQPLYHYSKKKWGRYCIPRRTNGYVVTGMLPSSSASSSAASASSRLL